MFISQKVAQMKACGASFSEIVAFRGLYEQGLAQRMNAHQAIEFAELTTAKRNAMQDSTFAIPEERKFPIGDLSHARNALARSSGTKYEARVKAAVYKKWPSLKPEEKK
jgi:hypothetical protein